jgi:heptosyltransferase III
MIGRPIEEITVVRAGALGDTMLALPAVSVLRFAFPGARIRAVGYPANWAVAGGLVDDVRSVDGPAMVGLLTNVPDEGLRRVLGSSDLVVAWTARNPTPALHTVGIRRVVHASSTPPPSIHAARWLLQSLSELLATERGFSVSSVDLDAWRIPYAEVEVQQARALLAECRLMEAVLMHPGAGAEWKRWPAERFAATGTELVRRGLRVALLQGPADEAAVAAVQDHAARPFPVVPPLEARALGALLSQVPCYLGNDSGVTHLAGASGVPTVALFGPTDPATWRPLGHTTVLRQCTAASRTDSGIRVCDDPDCLQAITVEEALDAIERMTVQNSVENRR